MGAASHTVNGNGFGQAQDNNKDVEEESGLVTSDSDFEMHEKAAGYDITLPGIRNKMTNSTPFKPQNIRKDVSKTFKKMLTSNHQR